MHYLNLFLYPADYFRELCAAELGQLRVLSIGGSGPGLQLLLGPGGRSRALQPGCPAQVSLYTVKRKFKHNWIKAITE